MEEVTLQPTGITEFTLTEPLITRYTRIKLTQVEVANTPVGLNRY